MQRDYWYSSMRDARELGRPKRWVAMPRTGTVAPASRKVATASAGAVRVFAGCRAARRIRAGDVGRLALRKSSFLEGSLGQPAMAATSICMKTRISSKQGQRAVRRRGVATRVRDVVKAGIVQGYFLSCYSARKLGMKTTGHAGGSHNLTLTSRLTKPGDNLDAMLAKLHAACS